jgi:hypothetical protein
MKQFYSFQSIVHLSKVGLMRCYSHPCNILVRTIRKHRQTEGSCYMGQTHCPSVFIIVIIMLHYLLCVGYWVTINWFLVIEML